MKILTTLTALLISTALTAQNDSAQIYLKKAQDEHAARRYLVASQMFEKSFKFNPSLTEAYLGHAYANIEMRKIDAARMSFLKVHEQQPSNKEVIRELMELHYNYRQFNLATEYAAKCLDCKGAQRVFGMSYYKQEDYPKAEKALLTALKQDPNDAEATYTLARTYLDMEEYKKAIPFYEKAVSLDKTKNGWMYELGLLYFNLADYKNAVSAMTEAAANGYTRSNDFNENLGYAMLYNGDYEKGEQLLVGIWERKPGNKELLRDMAELLYQQKQYDRSLFYCQKLMTLDANDAKALYQAGLNFQKKGNKDRGQQMCDKAISMDPSLASLRQEKKMPGM